MGRNIKVLVVDDDPNLLFLTSEIMRKAGYEVLAASSGKDCIEIMRRDQPDLVLLDVVLPDMSGVEVCKRIKKDKELRSALVLLMSGVQVSSDYQADALNVGADGYIVKPISNKELIARVQAMERIIRAEEALQTSELRYRRLFETAQDGILILDGETWSIEDANPSLIEMLGYTREEIMGHKLWEIGLFKNEEAGKAAFRELYDKGFFRYKDLPFETKSGREMAVECVSNIHDVENRKVIQCNLRDVTDRKSLEETLKSLSLVDDLTGLYNRRGFMALAEQQLKIAERTKQEALIFFFDLDNMKSINDTLGHQQGDKALIEVASALKETFRKSDVIARLGGDEFAALAIDATHETEEVLINRLRSALEASNHLKLRNYALSLSTGIARYEPGNPSSLDALIARADALMYDNKRTKQRSTED
jgi:diguanylate cyclase (GGDEF)-like protein/PAS domain S-box-containing protein